jgi:putative Holliday junction resolvase
MRFVALDVGEVRIVGTLRRVGSLKRDVAAMAALIAEQEADAVVVGLPLSLDGEIGPQAQRVQGFARALKQTVPLPQVFWDESLTSVEADELMIAQGVSRARRRENIDQMAAALILENYLAHRRAKGAPRDALAEN